MKIFQVSFDKKSILMIILKPVSTHQAILSYHFSFILKLTKFFDVLAKQKYYFFATELPKIKMCDSFPYLMFTKLAHHRQTEGKHLN